MVVVVLTDEDSPTHFILRCRLYIVIFFFLLICSIRVFVMLFAPWGWGGKVSLSDDILSLCDISPGKKRLKGIFWSGERMYGLLADPP